MSTTNAIILMVWTGILHLMHSSAVKSEIKKIGPMIAKKLWEDRAMRAQALKAVKTVETEVKRAGNDRPVS